MMFVQSPIGYEPRRASVVVGLALLLTVGSAAPPSSPPASGPEFADLSLLVASNLPCTWPAGWPSFQINPYQRIGALSAYNSEILTIDGNTGTQLDVPPHSVPLPDSKLPNAAPVGLLFTDKIPAWQFCGEACVLDCRDLLDSTPNGRSDLVKKERVMAWEKKHRPLGRGDVVLFHSGYSDKYYQPFPAGRHFIAEPLEGRAPAWPDPDPECMEYLAGRKVMTLGTDSPTMGPIPDLAEPTHLAGLKHGMIWTEAATGLGQLPTTGAFYCMLCPKHAGGAYGEGRAFAILRQPLAKQLIQSTRNQMVVDLSVPLADDLPVWWPGAGAGRHRHPYLKTQFAFTPTLGSFHRIQTLDSHTGTHLVPPAYALPPKGFDNRKYDSEVQAWLAEYESKHGLRGNSDVTTEHVPISQTCGWIRVIDVKHLLGTTARSNWPASPEITVADITKYEERTRALRPGEIIVFHSGWSDRYCKPFPAGNACLADPLNGKCEGWPAPGPETVMYLARKGIRCLGTDGPTLGGAEPKRALMTYWAMGTKGLAGVEYLTNIGRLPERSYFLFAAVKIEGCHGGPGRALAL